MASQLEFISGDLKFISKLFFFKLYRMTDSPIDSSDAQISEAIPRVGVTDAERELANNAHVEFESRQYDR